MAGLLSEGHVTTVFSKPEFNLDSGDSVWLVFNRYAYNMYNEMAEIPTVIAKFIFDYEIAYK